MIIYSCQKIACFLTKAVFNLEIEGAENLKLLESRQYFIIANHRNYIDPFIVSAAFPMGHFLKVNLRYMAHHKYIKKFPWIYLLGAYPVYPKSGSMEEVLTHTEKLIIKGKNILMFPEGKISETGESLEARPGIAYLAKKHNLQILPIAINGSFGFRLKDAVLRKKIFLKIGKPFYCEDFFENKFSSLAQSGDVLPEYDDNILLAQKIMERINEILRVG